MKSAAVHCLAEHAATACEAVDNAASFLYSGCVTDRSINAGGKPTLREVARETNVHLSTVSHVLNGAGGSTRVSEDTRQRVLDAARRLGYTPNRAAQQLRTQKSQIVGLLVGGLENPFFARMVSLCAEALERKGYDTVLAVRRADETNDLHLLQALVTRRLDGILLWSEMPTETRQRVQEPDMTTTIVMGYPIAGRDCVAGDLEVGVNAALDHLWSRGCTRIAYFAPVQSICREGDPRYDIYRRYMHDRRLEPAACSYDGSAFDVAAARSRAEALAHEADRPDALLCFNDMAAVGALMGLRRQGMRVPQDVALIGCDDLPLAAELDVALTSIRYPLAEVCQRAVEMLIERIEGQRSEGHQLPPRHVLVPTALSVRESSLA